MMTYAEALNYIYGLTDFERSGKFRNDREQHLLREGRLLEELGNPHYTYSSTLIAGTKGKGSTAVCVERVLRAAGVRTGLYTQPDLHTFRERMRVCGTLISENEVASLVPEVRAAVERIEQEHIYNPFIPYEVATALTLLYFARQQVRHAVLEVGIGGRLDATNVTHPLVSVIASISFDHMHILGNTLGAIATEKAGIIKPGGIVVTSAQSPEALLAIYAIAQERHARMIRVGSATADPAQAEVDAGRLPPLSYRYQSETRGQQGQTFSVTTPEKVYAHLEIPLAGLHQLENATLAVATLETLRATGKSECQWQEEDLREGLKKVAWSARLEIIGRQPTIIADGAHNTDSVQKLLEAVEDLFPYQRLFIVLGMNADKDLSGIIQCFEKASGIILTSANNPRSASVEQLAQLCRQYFPHIPLFISNDSSAAMQQAQRQATSEDLICATGSLYLVAEVLRWAAAQGEGRVAESIEGVDH